MSRISEPNLPQPNTASFVPYLTTLFRTVIRQLNGLTEGRIAVITNGDTAPPTTGQWQRGDFIRNTEPTESGSVSSKYIIYGWLCTIAGEPGTWKELRCLTGN